MCTELSARGDSGGRTLDRLRSTPPRQRRELLAEFLQEQFAYALGVEKAQVDRRDPLMDAGMDSLRAIEAKLYLEDELGIELESTLLFDHPTIEALAGFLLETLDLGGTPSPASGNTAVTAPATTPATAIEGPIDGLSGAELADMLAAELALISRETGEKGR
jgi:myxalamid-type polyketide synthase MxaB